MKTMMNNGLVRLALASLTLGFGCDGEGGTEPDAAADDGAGTDSADGGLDTDGADEDGDDADGDADGSGDDTADGADDGSGDPIDPSDDPVFALVGPTEDPAPDRSASGAYECDGCAQAMIDTADASVGDAPSVELTGTAVGHDQPGRFYVEGPEGHFAGGMLLPDADNGTFLQNVPLFCGDNTVKALFRNEAGTSVYVKHVERTECMPAAVRATLAWDDTSEEWNLHLVRFGGTLQGDETDCYDAFSCDGTYMDWGTPQVVFDNPHADVDPWLQFAGVANVTVLVDAEDGMTLAVDNIDDANGGFPRGIVYVNLAGQPTQVVPIDGLPNFEVFVAATVDGAAGSSSVVAQQSACVENWSDGCTGPLP